MCAALLACLALVGCGSGSESQESELVGYWEVVDGQIEDTSMDDLLEFADAANLHLIIYFDEDGTGVLDAFGNLTDFTYDAVDMTITVDGEDEDISLEAGQLTIDEGDNYFVFEKSDEDLSDVIEQDEAIAEEWGSTTTEYDEDGSSSTVAEKDLSEANTTEAIDPVTVADDDVCTIIVTGKMVDADGDAGYYVDITNNGDANISVYSPYESATVDGIGYELWQTGASDIEPGETRTAELYFEELSHISNLNNVTFGLAVHESESEDNSDIAEYSVTIP